MTLMSPKRLITIINTVKSLICNGYITLTFFNRRPLIKGKMRKMGATMNGKEM